MKRKWLQYEIEYLQENFKRYTCEDMAKYLKRTTKSVQHKYNQLGLNRMSKVGDKIHDLTILHMFQKHEHGQMKTYAICKCICYNFTCTKLAAIVSGNTRSCGCLFIKPNHKGKQKERIFKHGNGNLDDRLYRIWCAMKSRCRNPKTIGYHNYGGRGIKVCEDWINHFPLFKEWSLSNGYADNLSIDRIDVNGNYCPENCKWATQAEQCANRRNNRRDTVFITAYGETKTAWNWLSDPRCSVKSITTLIYRIGAGWNPEEAVGKASERS